MPEDQFQHTLHESCVRQRQRIAALHLLHQLRPAVEAVLACQHQLRATELGWRPQPVGRGARLCGGVATEQGAMQLARLSAQVVQVGTFGQR